MDQPRAHPTFDELTIVLAHLAERVAMDNGTSLDPVVELSLERVVEELKRYIPGLDEPPDRDAAQALARAATKALRGGRVRYAFSQALRGLSFSPHDPNLWHLAASACLQKQSAETAILILQHSLWINPGHQLARQDLEALSAFYDVKPDPWLDEHIVDEEAEEDDAETYFGEEEDEEES